MVLTCFDTFGPSLGHNESHDHRFWLDLICSDHAPYYILQTGTWVWTHPTSGFGEIGPTGDLLLLSDTYVLVFCVFLVVLAILLQILVFGILTYLDDILMTSWWYLDDLVAGLHKVAKPSWDSCEPAGPPWIACGSSHQGVCNKKCNHMQGTSRNCQNTRASGCFQSHHMTTWEVDLPFLPPDDYTYFTLFYLGTSEDFKILCKTAHSRSSSLHQAWSFENSTIRISIIQDILS